MNPLLCGALIDLAPSLEPDHLYHADGSPYMLRYWISHDGPLAARLHHICTPDLDRHMHDHPWDFTSVVLRGSYVEARPLARNPVFNADETEPAQLLERTVGSVAMRRATDRHRIVTVSEGGCWTLVHLGERLDHPWGFYTPAGKVYHYNYASVHAAAYKIGAPA